MTYPRGGGDAVRVKVRAGARRQAGHGTYPRARGLCVGQIRGITGGFPGWRAAALRAG